ncbi:MAG: penicillin-binding protein 1A [Gammaproteobacteria bacterium]
MPIIRKFLKLIVILGFLGVLTGTIALGGAYLYLEPKLPSVDVLRDVKLQVPLRVYTRDGVLIAEFGEQRRKPLSFDQYPEKLRLAFVSAEDERFFSHPGVDVKGLAAAAWELATTGEKKRGGSTITMQVARNYFLTREKSYVRKLNEIFLALKIEKQLSKAEILELYMNKIFLGHRAYGVAAASEVYYGVPVAELSLAQMAMIAGLPKAPSTKNPVTNPEGALARRAYVLGQMRRYGHISEDEYRVAMEEKDRAKVHAPPVDLDAPYIAEMVRARMVERYGKKAYTDGFNVYTRIESNLQEAAQKAVQKGLLEYDRRHGYRGPERQVALPAEPTARQLDELIEDMPVLGGLQPALVLGVEGQSAEVHVRGFGMATLDWEAMSWARPYINEFRRGRAPKTAADILTPGDVIRVERLPDSTASDTNTEGGKLSVDEPVPEPRWRLAEVPAVEGALAAIDPRDGGIVALVGGFDFYNSKFNRAVQAKRQAGSSFKPFVYTSALTKGFTPGSIINDAPVVFDDKALEGTWRPENYSGKFFGPTRLREALVRSRNLVSIRLLRKVGIGYAVDFLSSIGFPREDLPQDLSLALGSAAVAPVRLATSFAVLANGGFRVDNWLIERVESATGEVLHQARPATVCKPCEEQSQAESGVVAGTDQAGDQVTGGGVEASALAEPMQTPEGNPVAPRVIPATDGYLTYTMMQDVIRRGTGRRALVLKRKDLAGKTGTTNDQQDAWFSGFNGGIAATAWVGFDQIKPLGASETGGRAALPIWIEFMKTALKDMPEMPLPEPPGIVRARINKETGEAAAPSDPDAMFELFRAGTAPVFDPNDTGPTVVPGGPTPANGAEGSPVEQGIF